jgi:serpin B
VINAWVAEHTEGLIADLLPPGVIDANTALVMTDAVYFAAPWAFRFGKYGVIDGMFTRLDGTTVPVELMRHLETVGQRGRGEGFLAAELPYLGDEFSMLLILPDEGEYQAVRQRLDQALLDVIDATFEEGRYELLMPKWDYDSSLDLIGWLAEQGVAPGHYPGIGPGVWLDAAVHAADVSVNEWGTVAAAATGFVTDMSGVTPPSFVLRLDRPFLYLLRHSDSGLVLFAGQVTDPTT